MHLAAVEEMRNRLAERVRTWRVDAERVTETDTAFLAFGARDDQSVVLKVVRTGADEWHAGQILAAFEGRGAARGVLPAR